MTAKQLTQGLSGCAAVILVASAFGAGAALPAVSDDGDGAKIHALPHGAAVSSGPYGPLSSELDTARMLDARERAFSAKRETQLARSGYPYWFERVAAAHSRSSGPVVDDRFTIDGSVPVAAAAPGAVGDSRDWLQIGLALGLGALGVVLAWIAARLTRPRRVAH